MGELTRVLIADDDPLVREFLRYRLGLEPDVNVVGEAEDGEGAVRRAEELQPDVLLLDLVMPPAGGFPVAHAVRGVAAATRVLVLTNHRPAEHVPALAAADVAGYVVKTDGGDQVLAALRTVRAGGTCFDPAFVRQLAASPADGGTPAPRELEVLALVAEGLTTQKMAARLGVCARTVEGHVDTLGRRLGAANRAELVHLAHRRGWLT